MNQTAVKEKKYSPYRSYPAWYRELNESAREKEKSISWPDAREEVWRRTDLKRLKKDHHFKGEPNVPGEEVTGRNSMQTPRPEDKRLRYSTLQDAIRGDFTGVRKALSEAFNVADNRFLFRLLSEAPQGLYFYLPRNYSPSDILFLENRLLSHQGKECSCGGSCACGGHHEKTREEHFALNVVVLEEGAQAEIWERISQEQSEPILLTRATLFYLKEGSTLRYYRTQSLHEYSQLFDFSRSLVEKGANFYLWQAEKGIDLNKTHITADLRGSRAQAELKGIYQNKNSTFNEIFTSQIHRAPGCTSRSLYRGVLEDQGYSVFNGLIKVFPEASKTDAYLTNNNLLMNDGCRADSIPGLKIETNDVKCSHGSTSGKVDMTQIYYLQSRGFSFSEAKALLTSAFLEEVVNEVPDLVKREMEIHWDLKWEEDYA